MWSILAALLLGAVILLLPVSTASGGKGHHHHGGKKVKGVVVNVKVTVDFVHRIDDSYMLDNGACGSGDPGEDFSPADTHTAATATWSETFKGFAIVPGSSNVATATPDLKSSGWQNLGYGYEDPTGDGNCRSTQEKIPWSCHGSLKPINGSATLAGTTKASQKAAFEASLGSLRFRPSASECGSASSFEPADPTQYLDPAGSPQSILGQLTFGGEDAKRQTFVITPKQYKLLVKGQTLGVNGTGEFPALPFRANCDHSDNAVIFSDACSQVFNQKRTLVVKPVKVIRGHQRR